MACSWWVDALLLVWSAACGLHKWQRTKHETGRVRKNVSRLTSLLFITFAKSVDACKTPDLLDRETSDANHHFAGRRSGAADTAHAWGGRGLCTVYTVPWMYLHCSEVIAAHVFAAHVFAAFFSRLET